MTLRIVHVASGREWRGGQRQVWFLARALAQQEMDQVVVTGADSELARRLTASAITVRAARWHTSLDPRALVKAYGEAKRAAPGLLHAHDSHALTLAIAAGGFTRTPVVATRRTAFEIKRPWIWKRADRVIAISQAVARRLDQAGVAAERVSVISSGIDLDLVRGTPTQDPRPRLGCGPDTPLAIAIGALDQSKGHETLIRAADLMRRELPALRWIILGEGPERSSLQRQITELGLESTVHLWGHSPCPEAILGSADVLVASPVEEGLGTALLDAMALDIPVVAAKVGGIPEVLAGGAGLLVPPASPDALARAVVRILTHVDERREMVRRASERVRVFDHRQMARAVASVYRSML